ncbi:MAG: hypothetical protein JW757_00840 [Anaerolineales bacterium]|nr:hypothetical protein [Anaerolineales bacterium]
MNPDLGVFLSPTIPLTILVESGILFLWSQRTAPRWERFTLRLVILTIANIITQLLLITALILSPFQYWPTLLVMEFLIVLIEAGILTKTALSGSESLRLSLLVNLVSFGIGLVLPF